MEVQVTIMDELVSETKPRKKETAPRVRTKVSATRRLIDYAKEAGEFTLTDAMGDLGLKETCLRTHMSFINSNPARFDGVVFRRRPKTKIYQLVETK